MSKPILTECDCRKLIQNYLKRSDLQNLQFEIKPFWDKPEGILGEHYKLTLNYELDGNMRTDVFFLKVRPTDSESRQTTVTQTNAYGKEIFFYEFLLKEYERYNIDTSFAPKSFYTVPDELLVLENLVDKGYWMAPLHKVYDMDQLKCVLITLAKMHGAAFIYEEMKSKENGKPFRLVDEYPEIFAEEKYFDLSTENALSFLWIRVTVDALIALTDELNEPEIFKEELKDLLRKKKLGAIFKEKSSYRYSTGHSDLWSNNILFKSESGVVSKCCLVDFQLTRYFHPAYDVVLVIYCNTRRNFRQMHLQELYKYYHMQLRNVLIQHGYEIEEIYPEKVFQEAIKICEYEAQIQAASHLSFSCSEENYLPEYTPEERYNMTFVDRSEYVKENCKLDEKYRKNMLDCLYDLHDILIQK